MFLISRSIRETVKNRHMYPPINELRFVLSIQLRPTSRLHARIVINRIMLRDKYYSVEKFEIQFRLPAAAKAVLAIALPIVVRETNAIRSESNGNITVSSDRQLLFPLV